MCLGVSVSAYPSHVNMRNGVRDRMPHVACITHIADWSCSACIANVRASDTWLGLDASVSLLTPHAEDITYMLKTWHAQPRNLLSCTPLHTHAIISSRVLELNSLHMKHHSSNHDFKLTPVLRKKEHTLESRCQSCPHKACTLVVDHALRFDIFTLFWMLTDGQVFARLLLENDGVAKRPDISPFFVERTTFETAVGRSLSWCCFMMLRVCVGVSFQF